MIEFYQIPKDERNGIGVWIDAFIFEDMYFTIPVLKEKHNPHRMKRFGIFIKFIIWMLVIRIPLKHVGHICYGRKLRK